MPNERTLMKVMGITHILTGIFFFVIGLFMLLMMGVLSAVSTAMSELGSGSSQLGMVMGLGWIFSIITFVAGIFSIITAVLLFLTKE